MPNYCPGGMRQPMSKNETEHSTACDCSTNGLLRLSVHYKDGPVSTRTVRAGDNLTISAGDGYCIDKVTVSPAIRPIKGTKWSHGESPKREATRQ